VLGELVEEGFTLALDNFAYRPELEPLLRLASVATLDIQALDREGQADHVRRLRGHGLTVIAEKVETRDELEHCLADLLAELPLDERTTEALLDHVGPEGRILRTVLAYERHRNGRRARLNARRAPAR
jgi:c-di-GMP-related signal transduction protein